MRICIVDDNAIVMDSLALLLRDAGHEVHCAGAAEEGAAVVEQAKPDCVLVDLDLPGTKGDALAASLRARYRSLPIILTSGHQAPPGAVGPKGADLFLAKPFTPSALAAAFAKILALRDDAP